MYGLKNIIKDPTCFKSEIGTLLDVILTSNARRVAKSFNLINGVSDFHNIITFSARITLPCRQQGKIVYRSYKHFDQSRFRNDVSNASYHVGENVYDIDDKYDYMEALFQDIIESHAPLKSKNPLNSSSPYMNLELGKSLPFKAMLRNKYFRNGKTKSLWEE